MGRREMGKVCRMYRRYRKVYKIVYCIFIFYDNLWLNNILILCIEIWWLK